MAEIVTIRGVAGYSELVRYCEAKKCTIWDRYEWDGWGIETLRGRTRSVFGHLHTERWYLLVDDKLTSLYEEEIRLPILKGSLKKETISTKNFDYTIWKIVPEKKGDEKNVIVVFEGNGYLSSSNGKCLHRGLFIHKKGDKITHHVPQNRDETNKVEYSL